MSLGKRPVSGQEVGAGLPPRFRPARSKEGLDLRRTAFGVERLQQLLILFSAAARGERHSELWIH